MDQELDDKRYINTEFIYRQHLVKTKRKKIFTLKPGRFINKECLKGRPQWEYINNKYLQYVQKRLILSTSLKKIIVNQEKARPIGLKGASSRTLDP